LKHGVNPTKAQKIRLKALKLVPGNWLIVKDLPTCLVVEHRESGKTRTLELGMKKPSAPTESHQENSHLDCTIDVSKVESLMDPAYLREVLRNEA